MRLLGCRVGISVGGLEKAQTASANGADAIRRLIGRSIELRRSPKLRRGIRLRDFGRLQLAYSTATPSPCKQKRPLRTAFNHLILLRKSGAAIATGIQHSLAETEASYRVSNLADKRSAIWTS